MLEIVPISAFSDNYIWLVHDPDSRETIVSISPWTCFGSGSLTVGMAFAARGIAVFFTAVGF